MNQPGSDGCVATEPNAPCYLKPVCNDLRDVSRRFIALAFCRADILLELNKERKIVFAEIGRKGLFGESAGLIGVEFLDLVVDSDRKLAADFLRVCRRHGRIDDAMMRIKTAKGEILSVVLGGYRVPDLEGHFFLALKIDPPRLSKMETRYLQRDEATGVLEKKDFAKVASARIGEYRRAGGEAKMTLLRVEELAGEDNGLEGDAKERVLGAIGGVLKAHSLGGDTAGRVDEAHYGFVHDAATNTDAVRAQVEDAARQAHPDKRTISARTTAMDMDGADVSEKQMAKALIYTLQEYCANKGEMGDTGLSGMLSKMTSQTMKSINVFKKICQTRNFDLVFMPICSLADGTVHHFELLSRFEYGEKGAISPFRMITLAEEVDEINNFDFIVVQKAIETISAFSKDGPIPKSAVNVSGNSIANPLYLEKLHRYLAEKPNASGQIMFEITESARIDDLEAVNGSIQELRALGFEVCLDDFGAGAASFDYLNALEVDVVKFDGPVVKRSFTSARGKGLISSLAAMCRSLGVETVAEMVESEQEARFLHQCGVEFGQGYHYGKPNRNPKIFLS